MNTLIIKSLGGAILCLITVNAAIADNKGDGRAGGSEEYTPVAQQTPSSGEQGLDNGTKSGNTKLPSDTSGIKSSGH